MQIKIEKMLPKNFDRFFEHTAREFAKSNVIEGVWAKESSFEKALEQSKKILPDGINTKGHHFYELFKDGEYAAYLWFSEMKQLDKNSLYLWDIFVLETYRDLGIGKHLMEFLDEKAVELNAKSIKLHVFGYNTVAYNMYLKKDFQIKSSILEKKID